jgi:glycine/D-amino acid oxidase-like deaminating enzyme
MNQQVYWHTTTQMDAGHEFKPLPAEVDVAIIGAGYTGLSAARASALQGARTVVLEAETTGWGASSRNGGMVLTGLKLPMQTVIKKYGRDLARQLFQCSLESIDTVEQIVREEKIECGFARTGHLLVANKPAYYEALKREIDFLKAEFGHEVSLVPPERMGDELGSENYPGGLLDPASAGLNPAQYVMGLALAAENSGAVLCSRARVKTVHPLQRFNGKRGFSLQTERGTLTAEHVLVATAGYTGEATPALKKKIMPIGSFVIASEPLPEHVVRGLIPHQRMVFDYRHFLNYFRLSDKRLIFGGRAAFFPENDETIRQSAGILREEMVKVFPQLAGAQVDYAWGGTLDFAFDMMAHVGEQEGLAYSLGYAGHGVAMGTYLGKTAAEAMLAGRLGEHPFAALGFPEAPLGLSGGSPWFLPLAGLWYRMLDMVE